MHSTNVERLQRSDDPNPLRWLIVLCGLILVMWPNVARARTIAFAGQEWTVRSGTGGPGPNQWSASEESVWVDKDGLHLKIRNIGGVWHCTEVTSVLPSRYGVHRFYVASRIDRLDRNVVASPFLYKDDSHEVDIEFSRWHKPSENNAQYVVQPYRVSGNIQRFEATCRCARTTHCFDWEPSSIRFKSFRGHTPEPRKKRFLIQEWTYVGADNPAEGEGLRIHINLWLVKGAAPSNGKEVEFIVKNADLPGPAAALAGVANTKTTSRE